MIQGWAVLRRRRALSGASLGSEMLALDAWRARAQQYGSAAVLDIRQAEDPDRATERQAGEIFPVLGDALEGWERTVLDFGCGPGRFSARLAGLCGGICVGVDPVPELLAAAPKDPSVLYVQMALDRLPVRDESVDVVWSCLTLGALSDRLLVVMGRELRRVARSGALMVVIDNTDPQANGSVVYRPRAVNVYQRVIPGVDLKPVHDYEVFGERISCLVGRRP